VDRIRAAAEAARSLPFLFTLTGRAENYLWGRPDLRDTIRRLQAYQDAGADVLYAPGLTSKEEIAAVVAAVDRPVNVLMGMQGVQLSRKEMSAFCVKRISVGSALTRVALGAFLRAAREMLNQGTFTLASMRGAATLAKSPAAEREQWQRFWADVAALLASPRLRFAFDNSRIAFLLLSVATATWRLATWVLTSCIACCSLSR
jgi:2-methylisocitrate lyase-like PEP mutase family enzyme